MASITVKVFRTDTPSNSLSMWLAGHHPDLFVAILKRARAAQAATVAKQKAVLRGLGQDDSAGITTTFDTGSDPGVTTTFASPDTSTLTSFDPTLQPITIDQTSLEALPSNLLTDSNSLGAGTLASLGDTQTSSGGSLGGAIASQGGGGSMLSALAGVGSFLSSKSGLTALTGLATAVLGATTPQGQVVQTQVNRTTVGQTTAPITYTRDVQGNVVPVYATPTAQGTLYQPLTPAGISSLSPPTLQVVFAKYGVYIGLSAAVLLGVVLLRR